MNTRHRAALAALALVPLLTAARAEAQSERTCTGERQVRVVDLGYDNIECNCTMWTSEGRWAFRSEPTVTGIRRGGPADGKLRDGDVIVAIDGQLITTREGGLRFGRLRAGEPARLSVRRDGRVREVTIVPGIRCLTGPVAPRAPDAPAPPRPPRAPAAPATPRPPRPGTPAAPPRPPQAPPPPRAAEAPTPPPAPRAPQAPRAPAAPQPPQPPPPPPPVILPDGWFGFGIDCDNCGWHQDDDEDAVWTFRSAPTVNSVEPGSPAARAGVRRGDRLTAIDGQPITQAQAGRRFGAIKPGQSVRWTYERGGRPYVATIRAERRPDAYPAAAPRAPSTPAPSSGNRLRFSGSVGNAEVEVRGAPVTVTRDERTGETVIRSRDLTVRIRPEAPERS